MSVKGFARFDPKAADAKIWRTAENGKKYQLDDETGEILKGNVGQKPKGEPYLSRPLESTAPDKAHFDALVQKQGGNHKKAAREYFRERLQGRHVEAWTPAGPIEAVFTGDSWTELKKDMSAARSRPRSSRTCPTSSRRGNMRQSHRPVSIPM